MTASDYIAPELVACIADGREPTLQELGRLADRIASDLVGHQSISPWSSPTDGSRVRAISYRVAQAALFGDMGTSFPDRILAVPGEQRN
jgi:hypothetical protein